MLLHSPDAVVSEGEWVFKQTAATNNITWTVPKDVTSICVVVVGHGSLGGGGLSWKNNIPVTPGEQLTIAIRASTLTTTGGTILSRGATTLCIAGAAGWSSTTGAWSGGGGGGASYGGGVNDGGGNGGAGIRWANNNASCGGAAGYMGDGGATAQDSVTSTVGTVGSGSGSRVLSNPGANYRGGDVGLYGTGITGPNAGVAPSHGQNGSPGDIMCGGGVNSVTANFNGGIRIIWGSDRSYPDNAFVEDTNTIVPIMTANNAPAGYRAFSSSAASGGAPWMAFARNTVAEADGWFTSTNGPASGIVSDWLRIELPEPEIAKGYSMRGFVTWGIIDYRMEGSNNDTTWTALHTVTGRPASAYPLLKDYNIPNETAYKFYRIFITKIVPNGRPCVFRFNLYRDSL